MHKMWIPREFSQIPDQWHFAPVLDTGEFVFFSGITGVHPNKSLSNDPETQFRDAFKFLGAHLEVTGPYSPTIRVLCFLPLCEPTTDSS